MRERSPGVWEVPVFVGNDERGRPKQVSRTVRGSKRDVQRLAAELTVVPSSPDSGRSVSDVLDAWLETNTPTWAASTVRDQTSRASLVKQDRIGATPVGRLTVSDVERWHARLRAAGVGESSIRNQHLVLRAALSQAVRWEWVTRNVAGLASVGRRKAVVRSAMTADEVRALVAAAEHRDPAAGLALRLAAVTGARRSELCALVWSDLSGDRPLNPERLTNWWRLARRDAGIETRWRLHDLRHWSATEAIGRGHDLRTVSGRLGHANAAITLRTYAHAIDGADVAATLTAALEDQPENET